MSRVAPLAPIACDSNTRLAQAVIKGFDRLIYDEGSFWRLGEGLIWEPIDALELRRRVLLYGDQPIKDRPKKSIRLTHARCLDVVRVIQDTVDRPGFFSERPAGLVLKQTFFEVDGSKLLKVPLKAEHRQRFRYPFDFDGDAYPKRFIEELLMPCLASEPDVEAMIEMLRQFVAASLMRIAPRYQKALVLVGGGANGKSTVQEVFRQVFPPGRVSSVTPHDMGERFRKASLTDAWLNCVTELPSRGLHRVEALKALITGEPVQVELKNRQPYELRFQGGMICSGNTLPQVTDTSDGFWRRWLVVPFRRRFAEHEQIRHLAESIAKEEQEAIICWLLGGLDELLANDRYLVPDTCLDALDAWRGTSNPVARFVEQCTELVLSNDTSTWITGQFLYDSYVDWMQKKGAEPLSMTRFGRHIKRLPAVQHGSNARNVRVYAVRMATR